MKFHSRILLLGSVLIPDIYGASNLLAAGNEIFHVIERFKDFDLYITKFSVPILVHFLQRPGRHPGWGILFYL